MNREAPFQQQQTATILLPLDGSEAAMAALPIARVIAKVVGAIVHVVHVVPRPLPRKELLDALRLRPGQLRGAVIDQLTGPIAATIVQEAVRRQSTFIVMTVHGRTPSNVLGPIAREVLQQAPCPVIFVRPDAAVRPGGPGTVLRRILLPLDGVPSTTVASIPAIDLAERGGAELDILLATTAGVGRPAERGTFVAPRYVDQPHHEWPAWTQEFINRLCRCLGTCPAVPVHLSLAIGDPAEAILRVAAERRSDLIALAWRGRLNGKHGAIIKTVLHRAPCPVLILRVP